jgi:hypothetical protein
MKIPKWMPKGFTGSYVVETAKKKKKRKKARRLL